MLSFLFFTINCLLMPVLAAQQYLAPASNIGDPESDTRKIRDSVALYHQKYSSSRDLPDFKDSQEKVNWLESEITMRWHGRISSESLMELLELTLLKDYAGRPTVGEEIKKYFATLPRLVKVWSITEAEESHTIDWETVQDEILVIMALSYATSHSPLHEILLVKDFLRARQNPRIAEPFVNLALEWLGEIQGESIQWLKLNACEDLVLTEKVKEMLLSRRSGHGSLAVHLFNSVGTPAVVHAVLPHLTGHSQEVQERVEGILKRMKGQGLVELIREFSASAPEGSMSILSMLDRWDEKVDGPLDEQWYGPVARMRQLLPEQSAMIERILQHQTTGGVPLGSVGSRYPPQEVHRFLDLLSSRDLLFLAGPFLRRLGGSASVSGFRSLVDQVSRPIANGQWEVVMKLFLSQSNPIFRELIAHVLDLHRPFSVADAQRVFNLEKAPGMVRYLEAAVPTFVELTAIQRSVDLRSADQVASVCNHLRGLEENIGNRFLTLLLKRHRLPFVLEIQSTRRQVPVLIGNDFAIHVPVQAAHYLDGIPGTRMGSEQVVFTRMHFDPNALADRALRHKMELLEELRIVNDRVFNDIKEIVDSTDAFASRKIQTVCKKIINNLQRMIDTHFEIYADVPVRDALHARLSWIADHINAKKDITDFREEMNLNQIASLHTFLRYLHKITVEGFFEANRPTDVDWHQPTQIATGIMDNKGAEHLAIHPVRVGEIPPSFSEPIRYTAELLMDTADLRYHATPYEVLVSGKRVLLFKQIVGHRTEMMIDFAHPDEGGMVQVHWNDNVDYAMEAAPGSAVLEAEQEVSMSNREVNDLRRGMVRKILSDMGFGVRIPTADTITPFDRVPQTAPETAIHGRFDKDSGARTVADIYWTAAKVLEVLSATPDMDKYIYENYPKATPPYLGEGYVALVAQFLRQMGVVEFRRVVETRKLQFQKQIHKLEGVGETIRQGLDTVLESLGLPNMPPEQEIPMGQPLIDQYFRRPIEDALRDKRVIKTDDGQIRVNPTYKRLLRLDVLTDSFDNDLFINQMIQQASLMREVKDKLAFVTMGSINGYTVQKADYYARGRPVTLFVMLDVRGDVMLAYCNWDRFIYEITDPQTGAIETNLIRDPNQLLSLLQTSFPGLEIPAKTRDAQYLANERERIRQMLTQPLGGGAVEEPLMPVPGLAICQGIRSGRIVFNTPQHSPIHSSVPLERAVLVGERLLQDDESFLEKCRAVVVTGGSPLAHAGMIAREHGLPSVIIHGTIMTHENKPMLVVEYDDFKIVTEERKGFVLFGRKDLARKKAKLQEGDVVTVDGDEGSLFMITLDPTERVQVGKIFDAVEHYRKFPSDLSLRRLLSHVQPDMSYNVAAFLLNELIFWDKSLSLEERKDIYLKFMERARGALESRIIQRLHQVHEQMRREMQALITHIAGQLQGRPREPLQVVDLMQTLEKKMEELRNLESLMQVAPSGFDDEMGKLTDVFGSVQHKFIVKLERRMQDILSGRGRVSEIPGVLETAQLLGYESPRVAMLKERDLAQKQEELRTKRDKWVLPFLAGDNQVSRHLVELVGGKAASLGNLQDMAKVPPGFVVNAASFEQFLNRNMVTVGGASRTLKEAISDVVAKNLPPAQAEAAVRELIQMGTFEMIPEIRDEILSTYRKMGSPWVAVRSSAIAEDSEKSSFAGQMKTILNVSGDENILNAIKEVWASLWTARAISYRKSKGIAMEFAHAVAVQKMVRDARVSGVVTTINPMKKDPSQIVVNAGYGLGEGPISGDTDADQFILDKYTLRVIQQTIADKKEQYVSLPGGGTRKVPVPDWMRKKPSLTPKQLRELAQVALRIKRSYGPPIDMEFAREDEESNTLQARPITTFWGEMRYTLGQLHPREILVRFKAEDSIDKERQLLEQRNSEITALVQNGLDVGHLPAEVYLQIQSIRDSLQRDYLMRIYRHRGPTAVHWVAPGQAVTDEMVDWLKRGDIFFHTGSFEQGQAFFYDMIGRLDGEANEVVDQASRIHGIYAFAMPDRAEQQSAPAFRFSELFRHDRAGALETNQSFADLPGQSP